MTASHFQCIGMSQGKYRIDRTSIGQVIVVPGVEGLAFARRNARGGLSVDAEQPGPGKLTLSAFRQRVLGALAPVTPPPRSSMPPATPGLATPGEKTPDVAR